MLKNWALLGVARASKGGGVTVTDMDHIEKSNLSRQLLFRAADIGSAKATCAARAARQLRADMRVTPTERRVGPDSEDQFDDAFWHGLDGVCTALDNVDARLYVDSKCLFYHKPLLESGTLAENSEDNLAANSAENLAENLEDNPTGKLICKWVG